MPQRSVTPVRPSRRRSSISAAREARSHLEDLGATVTGMDSTGFTGHRVFELGVEHLGINTDWLQEQALRTGVRTVPRSHVDRWVNEGAENAEQAERDAVAAEVVERFGYQARITHTADIKPTGVDAFTADFNARLREAWADRGVPTDVPDYYYDRCSEAGMTPEQCAAYWADGIPLELIP